MVPAMRSRLWTLLALSACQPPPPKQPDIVLVVVDTLRADHLGVYGYGRPTTPSIDALAGRGAVFTRAWSAAGWTLASFATLLTGEYPHVHRAVRDQKNSALFGELSLETTTLAEALHDAGYATAAFVNNPFLKHGLNIDQGFDVYDLDPADNKHIRSARATVQKGLAWLNQQQEKPAFLLLHFMEPHLGYAPAPDVRGTFASTADRLVPVPFVGAGMSRNGPPPEPKIRDYVVGLYDEEVLSVDKAVGELVSGLDQGGRWPRTLMVFTADHGEEHWDHGGFEHGHTLYSELVHVPLIVAGLGAPHGKIDTMVEHVDLFQGLLARAGATRPEGSVGTDLWSLVASPPPEPRYAFSETVVHGGEIAAITDGKHRLIVDLNSHRMECWNVTPDGREPDQVPEEEQRETGRSLFRELFDRRGGLGPIVPNLGSGGTSAETQEQLQMLGYLDLPSDQQGQETP